MLFLLKDLSGQGLLIAEAATKAEADAFGRAHLPEFCGESVEVDALTRVDAEKVWGVRTVRLEALALQSGARWTESTPVVRALTATQLFVWGPELPPDVEADDLLTPEDRRDLTLDHIARTCEFVTHLEIRKRT